MAHDEKRTTDHEEIQRWVRERGGRPSMVSASREGASGILRIHFGEPDERLEEIPWDDFFRIFDERGLVFLYQEKTGDGKPSRFFKFVRHQSVEAASPK